jgi:hypothetical protein
VTHICEWKSVVGYEGWYEVSCCGRIKRIAPGPGTHVGKVLKEYPRPDGYVNIQFCRYCVRDWRTVHSVVAESFIGPCPEGLVVDHGDFNRSNNRYTNLEYVTHLENKTRAMLAGRFQDQTGEKNPNSLTWRLIRGTDSGNLALL